MGEAMELGDVMEPAQVTDGVETAAEVTGTVGAMTTTRRRDGRRESCSDAVFRNMDLSPLQAVHPRPCYRRRLTRR